MPPNPRTKLINLKAVKKDIDRFLVLDTEGEGNFSDEEITETIIAHYPPHLVGYGAWWYRLGLEHYIEQRRELFQCSGFPYPDLEEIIEWANEGINERGALQ